MCDEEEEALVASQWSIARMGENIRTFGKYDTATKLSHVGRITTRGMFCKADCRCC